MDRSLARETLARRDVRHGGTWTPLQRVKNDLLWCAGALALSVARRLPLGVLRALGRALGRAAHGLGRGARARALSNVAIALPSLDERARASTVYRSYETLGEILGETVALLRGPGALPALPLADRGRATLEAAVREGRGVVFASAHLGPWENVAASLIAAGFPLVTVARESYDARFNTVYDALRRSAGVRVVWRSSASAPFRIVRAVRRGEVLGVPMDLRSRVPSIEAPFLGRPAPTPVGPARIALRTGAAVVVGTVAPRASGMAEPISPVSAGLEITATRVDTSGLLADGAGEALLTARINDELSRRILALPHAWVWMHERWPTAAEYA